MEVFFRSFVFTIVALLTGAVGCGTKGNGGSKASIEVARGAGSSSPSQSPKIPLLQKEILNKKDSQTTSPLGTFDFKNFTYPFPHGWQDRDSKELTLENGVRKMTEEKIGISYVTTKYFDVTGDGEDEAFVILKVNTGSITIPQIVYVFNWKAGKPNLIWHFRTGDRAAGGLKRIYGEDGEIVVELFGRDRYIFTKMETSKIVGDDVNLCCPTDFTRSHYKWQCSRFVLEGDRLTFSLEDKGAKPIKNMNEKKLKEERGSK